MRSSVPADAAAPAAAVVRVACSRPDWARTLPAVPTGATVTVSVASASVADQHAVLEARGYRVVGVFPSMLPTGGGEVADLLVPEGLIEDHPDWWRALTAQAIGVHSLHHGPVRRAFGLA